MADWVPIVHNVGADKNCGLCGKPIKFDHAKPTIAANMEADGITLTAPVALHMHSGCLKDVLLWAAGERANRGTSTAAAHAALWDMLAIKNASAKEGSVHAALAGEATGAAANAERTDGTADAQPGR